MLEHRACRTLELCPLLRSGHTPEGHSDKTRSRRKLSVRSEHTPVKISVPVKPIDWELEKGRYTPRLPAEGIARAVSDRIEYLELIPYGCTELRLTVFPQCN